MKEYYGIMLHESKEYGGVKITNGLGYSQHLGQKNIPLA